MSKRKVKQKKIDIELTYGTVQAVADKLGVSKQNAYSKIFYQANPKAIRLATRIEKKKKTSINSALNELKEVKAIPLVVDFK